MLKKMVAAAAVAAVTLLGAPAQAGESAYPDQTPGVVTRWEFRHVYRGDTISHVQDVFGTRGTFVSGVWGPEGYWYGTFRYLQADGHWCYVTYAARAGDGRVLTLFTKVAGS